MSNNKLNVMVVGVGGQGLITLSNLIARASLKAGNNAIVAETHGLSQRGGTVIVHVRIGDVNAPLMPPGEAHVMLSMELIEALRYSNYLREDGKVVVNDYLLPPPLPGIKVPRSEEIYTSLSEFEVYKVNATQKAVELGDPRVANIILLGKALKEGLFTEFFNADHLKEVLKETWPRSYETNLKALEIGLGS